MSRVNALIRNVTIYSIIILIIATLFLLVNIPCILYPLIPSLNPYVNVKSYSLSGSSLFISDLHLSKNLEAETYSRIGRFTRENNISSIIIVGDLFDSPNAYRYTSYSELIVKAINVLNISNVNVYYVLGSPVHDPKIPTEKFSFKDVEVYVVGYIAKFKMDNLTIVAYHGNDFSRIGALSFILSYITRKPFLEEVWRKLAGIENDVWLICGHTHIPKIDYKSKTANCGGWRTLPIVKTPIGYGVTVDSNISLIKIPEN
ncbi:MAG: metallophosphoesterase [Candidatus Methanomethylicia archaeon]